MSSRVIARVSTSIRIPSRWRVATPITFYYGISGASTVVLRLELRYSGGYQLRAALVNNATTFTTSNWFTISDAPHYLEIDWRAATAAGQTTVTSHSGSMACSKPI